MQKSDGGGRACYGWFPTATVLALCLIAMTLLGACASEENSGAVPDGPYKAQIFQARQQATSDFQREVLADGIITKAEFDEAVQRYVTCMADKGVEVKPYDMGGGYYGYAVGSDSNDQFQRFSDACHEGATALIEDLYIQMLTNPSGGNIEDAVAECLVRKGLVDATFTGAELRRLSSADPRGKNMPFDTNDPEAVACRINPQQ